VVVRDRRSDHRALVGSDRRGARTRDHLKGREDRTEITDAARAASIFVFVFFAAIGVIVAVGVTSRDSLRPFPAKLLSYSPHVLAPV
jgi:hypothetical protein